MEPGVLLVAVLELQEGGGTDEVFFENDQTATTSYSITANKHAHSVKSYN